MAATYADSIPGSETAPSGPVRLPWKAIFWFGALLILGYAGVLNYLVHQWLNDEDMGHGFFVPVVAGYIAWQRRRDLASAKVSTNYWGLVLVVFSTFLLMVGTLGAQIVVSRVGFLIALVGAILFLCGAQVLRILAFPLFLLLFMIPIPAMIYARITLPLQLFASRVAETVLGLFGIPVLRDGNVLELASQRLSVVEACSGIRSLLSLSFLSLVYAYFFDAKQWMRWALLAATVPIAIAANSARVTLTGLLSEYRADLAQGFFHTAEGWVLFIVALAMLIGAHQLINWIYRKYRGRHAAN
jgi:exosortase